MRKIVVFLVLAILLSSCSTIDFHKRGKQHLNTLASDDFHGRGYVHGGMKKAENYIAKELKKFKLKSPYHEYRQSFKFPINVIEESHLIQEDKELKFGIDYLVSPDAPEIQLVNQKIVKINIEKPIKLGENEIPYIDLSQFSDSLNEKEIKNLVELYKAQFSPRVVMLRKEKMIHSLAQKQNQIPTIYVHPEKIKFDLPIDFSVKSTFNSSFFANNIIAMAEGESSDSAYVLTAHYDHLGQVGETVFNGANDNASGASLLLNLAEYYSKNKPKYDTYFCFYAAEEPGLIGSKYSSENFPIDLKQIKFLINTDIVGTGVDGIAIVFGLAMPEYSKKMIKINDEKKYVVKVEPRGEACNSDHCFFHRKGVRTFFLYTMGGDVFYHDPLDRPEHLPLTVFNGLGNLIIDFLYQL